ncbi:MAG: carbohydrate binding family 9 domain-containing protein [Cyclobacteriaceae bacterium]|nr:carbohydrate binding family 9 domain-containing protein [Cyclobacteriaceae bacterium]
MKLVTLILLVMLGLVHDTIAQEHKEKVKSYITERITDSPPVVDGLINDEAWNLVEWQDDFTQRQPNDGEQPSMPTAFKILYDAKNLYVLVRAFDDEPDKISQRMSRRDGFSGDFVEINIDSYYDKRTAFSFTASASGVKGDEYISNNGNNWDSSWDPIWYLKTSVDEKGWVAEFRIPLSQLRFGDKAVHTWGIQVMRYIFRNQERSVWQYIPQDANGWVHLFGQLENIEGIRPQKQLEIQPYVVGKTEYYEKEEGNPFKTGNESEITYGVDGKIGLTSDITLDFTIFPDFGQVEADPSQVNLSAFQVFFREQRPFFIEGNNILDFQVSNSIAGGNFNSDNLFYSRRIGGSPHYFPSVGDGEYVDQPNNSKILGSAKITGKSKNGFSFGLLESVTQQETAIIDNNGDRREEEVEPMTNYLVGRIQQDINEGQTIVGAMMTATNRDINNQNLNFMHREAYTGGVDFTQNFNDRKYYLSYNGVFSKVLGTTDAIYQTQTSAERYFQRPDNRHTTLDSTRRALSGTGGTLAFGKSGGKIVFQTGATYRSPGLDLNDTGFLMSTDQVNQWTWAQYRILKPFSIFQSIRINGNQYLGWDFGGVSTSKAINVNGHMRFKNLWGFSMGSTIQGESISNADLRGGPSMKYPGSKNQWTWIGTDRSKKLSVNFNQWNSWGDESYSRSAGYWMGIRYRPIDALQLALEPNINIRRNNLQYVDTYNSGGNDRYLLAQIDQKTYNISLRLTYNLNPNLSIQYWGQPFLARGEYSNFKRVNDANSSELNNRYYIFNEDQMNYDTNNERYFLDENMDGINDYEFGNPNFDFVQFRSNMVMRWEYKPGSTLFVVWAQSRTEGFGVEEGKNMWKLYDDMFDINPQNTFLLKFTYRFIK